MKRVDNIPLYLKPLFLLYGYVLGVFFFLFSKFINHTCRINFIGGPLPNKQPVVYCIWHKDLLLYFGVFNRVQNQVWMNHPAWYMKPVHVLLRLTGVEHICLGSSGNSGKLALENVIAYLKQGYSTTVACDGPAGPPQQLKPGALWMSRDAGIPVVPLMFECKRSFRLGGWDRKVMPGLFTTINVHVGAPVQVTEQNFKATQETICNYLKE